MDPGGAYRLPVARIGYNQVMNTAMEELISPGLAVDKNTGTKGSVSKARNLLQGIIVIVFVGIIVGTGGCVGPCGVPFFLVRHNVQPAPPPEEKPADQHVELIRPKGSVFSTQGLPVIEVK